MEKPRKRVDDPDYTEFAHGIVAGYNEGLDAMSAWIEGELPSEDEIKGVLKEHHDHVDNMFYISDCAHAIHKLLTQRLGGRCEQ
jgi:hypothetical protein